MIHQSESDYIEDDDGFFLARCSCGFTQGPLPDIDTLVDELMQHAFEMGVAHVPRQIEGAEQHPESGDSGDVS